MTRQVPGRGAEVTEDGYLRYVALIGDGLQIFDEPVRGMLELTMRVEGYETLDSLYDALRQAAEHLREIGDESEVLGDKERAAAIDGSLDAITAVLTALRA